jgi:hypothetical protein
MTILNRIGMGLPAFQKKMDSPASTIPQKKEEANLPNYPIFLREPGMTDDDYLKYVQSIVGRPMTKLEKRLDPLRRPLWTLEKAWHKVKELVCGNQDEIYDRKRGDWVPPPDRR